MKSLGDALREVILLEGPITVERYMAVCLKQYYATRDPLGPQGDFTTSPEISQIFGELLGLWVLEVWHAMGRPQNVSLVELGPGRGTLMADMLRATKIVPDFVSAAAVHLIETSPALRQKQEAALASSGQAIAWHDTLSEIPTGPMLLVANEFFDALPVRQFVATERGWCERLVGVEGNSLTFGLHPEPEPKLGSAPKHGAVRELHVASVELTRQIATRLERDGGAALVIDYGYWGPSFGDTLQALKHHAFVDPLEEPGEADLTTHVDFAQLAHAGAAAGARVYGIDTQSNFLQALGILTRAARLKQRATDEQAVAIDQAVERLTATEARGMGGLFKVLALTHPSLESVPGLRPQADAQG